MIGDYLFTLSEALRERGDEASMRAVEMIKLTGVPVYAITITGTASAITSYWFWHGQTYRQRIEMPSGAWNFDLVKDGLAMRIKEQFNHFAFLGETVANIPFDEVEA